ncbi:hypothetical protein FB45DRAFT_1063039 [Roridomyces roridus]|uniref:Zinc finger PHD-type domain-containing protein n=1 Tax=Roridomyces roridus TaxID=1738132 RepID=A0AAD7BFZ7_9AGAR|nr:hypothetical protein FB45DRAFT_1063039 [Roridomyces roridus]
MQQQWPSKAGTEDSQAQVELGKTFVCLGIELEFPPGQTHHTSYPFGLHAKYDLPWNYVTDGGRFCIYSTSCLDQVDTAGALCESCRDLDTKNQVLYDIRGRIELGVNDNSPHIFLPIGGLIQKLLKKDEQLRALRLTKLNDTRRLAVTITELSLHKQLMMGIAHHDTPRVSALIRAGLNNGESIRAMLERFHRAATDVFREGPRYRAKGFTEIDYKVGLCALRMGGGRLADFLHRALGLPGLSSLRTHTILPHLRVSHGVPEAAEIVHNIDGYRAGQTTPTGPTRIIHISVFADEVKVDPRPRWDPDTNMIVGLGREDCGGVSLEYCTIKDAEVLAEAIDRGEVHIATEATVVATGVYSRDPRESNALPICISGTCKHETSEQHADFLRTVYDAIESRKNHGSVIYRTISFASDGESKRGKALSLAFMQSHLASSSPIYPLLNPLQLMNRRVGPDDITISKDPRHVIKNVRTLVMRRKGFTIKGFTITPSIIQHHLRSAGHSQTHINTLMNPNDKQHVPLAYDLLRLIWQLPEADAEADPPLPPTFIPARKALRKFGQFAYHLLMPFIHLTLSLHEQLTHLSTAAHLLFVMFSVDGTKTAFMANQTFVNIMLMMKDIYYSVAKVKINNPDGEFFIIQVGTNRLETFFGISRTSSGPDTNFDVLQLGNRASNITEVNLILSEHPEWDRGSRRLKLVGVLNENGDSPRDADHVSPASWLGDVHVKDVVLLTCWRLGRTKAEEILPVGRALLRRCTDSPGVDMLAPFGALLVDCDDAAEEFEVDPTLLGRANRFSSYLDEDEAEPDPRTSAAHVDDDGEDLDDLLGAEEDLYVASPGQLQPTRKKHASHVLVDGKLMSKARVLKQLLNHRSARTSSDRLKRVAGIPAFSHNTNSDYINFSGPTGAPSLRIGNPIATVVECEDQFFLAIAQVSAILVGGTPTNAVPLDFLSDRNLKVSYQVFRLVPSNVEDSPDGLHDWKWSTGWESRKTHAVAGSLVHPLDPTVSNRVADKPTYLFSSTELIMCGASLESQLLSGNQVGLPEIRRSDTYPYRRDGKACFLIELASPGFARGEFTHGDTYMCSKCEVGIPTSSAQRLLEHNGSHILFDDTVLTEDEPFSVKSTVPPSSNAGDEESDEAANSDVFPVRRATRKIVMDSDSDEVGSEHERVAMEADDPDERLYWDEDEVAALRQQAEETRSAGEFETVTDVQTDAAQGQEDDEPAGLSDPVPAQNNAPPEDLTTGEPGMLPSGRPDRKKRKKLESHDCECEAGLVTQAERENGSGIHCSKDGCETGWFHRSCMGVALGIKSWTCENCRRNKWR